MGGTNNKLYAVIIFLISVLSQHNHVRKIPLLISLNEHAYLQHSLSLLLRTILGSGGVISQTAGVWEMDTVEMRPRTHHVMRVEVSKDSRAAWFEQDFFVGEVDPPVITLK